MPLNIGFNPMDIFPDPNQEKMIQNQQYQQTADNQFRNTQFQTQEAWNWRKWNRQGTEIQSLVRDASKAGVSPLAALGSGGSAPVNVSMPVGQGGRAHGTYQRQSPLEMSATIRAAAETNSEINRSKVYEQQADLLYWQARQAEDRWSIGRYKQALGIGLEPKTTEQIDPLYVRALDNTDAARLWKKQGYVPLVNPEFGLEPPETIGGAYWLAPRF